MPDARPLVLALAVLAAAPALAAPGPPAEASRRIVAERLIEIGSDPGAARAAAGRLTAQDVAVLLANPKMLQAAGTSDVGTEMFLGTTLVIGAIVTLAIFGGGFAVAASV